jgi:hypothetical protein
MLVARRGRVPLTARKDGSLIRCVCACVHVCACVDQVATLTGLLEGLQAQAEARGLVKAPVVPEAAVPEAAAPVGGKPDARDAMPLPPSGGISREVSA